MKNYYLFLKQNEILKGSFMAFCTFPSVHFRHPVAFRHIALHVRRRREGDDAADGGVRYDFKKVNAFYLSIS